MMKEREEQDFEPEDFMEEELEDPRQKLLLIMTSSWGISVTAHVILVIILMSIYLIQPLKKKTPVIISRAPTIEQPFDETLPRALQKTPKIESKQQVEKPVKDITPEKVVSENPKGTSLDNPSTKNLQSTSTADAYGGGGGAAGAYGSRSGKGKWNRFGGSRGSESAVRAALNWLKRHQTPEGYWKSYNYDTECKKPIRCKNKLHGPSEDSSKSSEFYNFGRGFGGYDTGVTSLALLAFLGNGHTHKFGKFRKVVYRAVEWLKKSQVNDPSSKWHGSIGYIVHGKKVDHSEWIYNHAIATMALCELYAITNDFSIKDYAQRAVDFAVKCRNPTLGWSHHSPKDDPERVVKPGVNDSAVTGWMILAMKTAKNAGTSEEGRLIVPHSCFVGALKWFDAVTTSDGKMGYMTPSGLGSVLPGRQEYYDGMPTMTAVGVLCRLFAGQSLGNATIKKGVKVLLKNLPKWDPNGHRTTNMYYWYYGTYTMFQVGGKRWHCGKSYGIQELQNAKCGCWNHAIQKVLLLHQRQGVVGDCADGSWDPIGEWGIAGGRVYATAIGAITMEVFYRYQRLQK